MSTFVPQMPNGFTMGPLHALPAVGHYIVYGFLSFSSFSHLDFIVVDTDAGYHPTRNIGFSFFSAHRFSIDIAGAVAVASERTVHTSARILRFFMVSSLGVGVPIRNTFCPFIGSEFGGHPGGILARMIGGVRVGMAINAVATACIAAAGLLPWDFYINCMNSVITTQAAACDDMRTAGLMCKDAEHSTLLTHLASGVLADIAGIFLRSRHSVYPTLGSIQIRVLAGVNFNRLNRIAGAVYVPVLLGLLEVLFASHRSSALGGAVGFVHSFSRTTGGVKWPQGLIARGGSAERGPLCIVLA